MLDFNDIKTYPYLAGLISFAICVAIMPLVIKLAIARKWVVMPKEDRWSKTPTALMGGIGIFAAYSITIWLNSSQVNPIIYLAMVILFVTGLIDDLKDVKPIVKLAAQIVCSFMLLYSGFSFGGGLLGWAGIPLTFFWVIGITNAINLLDNMDGLAAGISAIIAGIAGLLAISNNTYGIASLSFALSGACLGFLIYNFKPAKIFMGDCGSLFLGFALCFFTIAVQGKAGSSSAIATLLVPISLMSIPIMDTAFVTIKRIVAGRRIDQGGRDHTSHRLVALGLSEKKAVILLYSISAVWGVVCILFYKTQFNHLLPCIILLSIFSIAFAIVLSKVKIYNESEEKLTYLRYRGQKAGDNFLFRFLLQHKRLISGIFIDISLISCAFFLAAECLNISLGNNYLILGLFIFIKMATFNAFNLYDRMWRYIASAELISYFIACIISSVIVGMVLYFKNKTDSYPFFFYMVDFLLTFTSILFSRLVYRSLIDLLNTRKELQQRVVIYGAGDRGYQLIKELMQNSEHQLKPVACIDDDISKHNMYLSGCKVYGGLDKVIEICHKKNATGVIISTPRIEAETQKALQTMLKPHQITLQTFLVSLPHANALESV
jgi:UDP-GlcNAc:undecaprenyl-phosphate GlcNAc-1-phosphate transferase